MKIIQIVTGAEGDVDHTIYGLGDDGNLYTFYAAREAGAYFPSGKFGTNRTSNTAKIQEELTKGSSVSFFRGWSNGWRLMATSDERSEALYHPLDPAMP